MSDICLNLSIKDESSNLFRRCIRRLLDSTFILKEKEPKLYAFLERESNQMDVRAFLIGMGFDLLFDDQVGLAMLIENPDCEEEVGLKRANIISLSPFQYHFLLVFWKIYLETYGIRDRCAVTKGDLIDKMKYYNLFFNVADFNAAMKLFKRHSLINFDENAKGEDVLITLYPSLQFGWNLKEFQTIANEYLGEEEQERLEYVDDTVAIGAIEEEEDE